MVADAASGALNRMHESRRTSRWPILLVLLVLTVVCAVVLPPLVNANRLRGRLATSLSAALGRPVQMDNVTLRLLPRPGFAFENLEVAEDPAFGAEPVMRAASVTVGVRLLPLWRGRIEVATVSLDQASVNLARNREGRWNFESLLQRTSQLPAQLPTAERRTSAGARFPYFEVTNSRVNFKRGAEKLPFSFNDAEFSLWLATPTEWRLRFRAMPVRTDLDAAYTGELRMQGSVRKVAGAALRGLPVELDGSWRHAPLGQWTRMMQERDGGWRGDASLDFTVQGTAESAQATARVRVDGLRRDDFVPPTVAEVDAQCTAELGLLRRTVTTADCVLPASTGVVRFSAAELALGRPFAGPGAGSGAVTLQHVPAAWMLDNLRLVRQGMSAQLQVQGEINGSFAYARGAAAGERLTGAAEWSNGTLLAAAGDKALMLPVVRLQAGSIVGSASLEKSPRRRAKAEPTGHRLAADAGAGLHPDAVTVLPVELAVGGTAPMRVEGGLDRESYSVALAGGVDLGTAAPLLRAMGFARWAVLQSVAGQADVALRVQDGWMRHQGSAPAQVVGTVGLRNVTAKTAWLPGPVHVARADATLAPGSIVWKDLQWTWAGAKFDGSATKTILCEDAASCAWHLTAHTGALNLQQVESLFAQSSAERLANLFRADGPGGWPLFQIDLTADTLMAGVFEVSHASASLTASGSTVAIKQCSGV